jgi:hypothetical protein
VITGTKYKKNFKEATWGGGPWRSSLMILKKINCFSKFHMAKKMGGLIRTQYICVCMYIHIHIRYQSVASLAMCKKNILCKFPL